MKWLYNTIFNSTLSITAKLEFKPSLHTPKKKSKGVSGCPLGPMFDFIAVPNTHDEKSC